MTLWRGSPSLGPTSASSGDRLGRLADLDPADDLAVISYYNSALQEMTCNIEGHRRKEGRKVYPTCSGIRPCGTWIKSNEWAALNYAMLSGTQHQSASIFPLSLNKVYLLTLWLGKSCMSRFNHRQNWIGSRRFAAFVRRGVWELSPTWMLIEFFCSPSPEERPVW